MKDTDQILTLLADGNATTRALADKLTQPERVILAFCEDLEITGAVTRQAITPEITVWSLTPQPAAV